MIKVMKFGASWCGPCRMIKPIITQVAREHTDVEFVDVDIDENPDLAKEYNIASVPTMIFEVDGKEVTRKSGILRSEDFNNIFKELK
tara:strand:+ start:2794 stop:3054 length:261 start_codon:yes stop_codon:yes gene_type:complete